MPLGWPFDAIDGVQAGIEPLRAVGRGDLVREHVAELVVKCLAIIGRIEIPCSVAPEAPGIGEPMENLPGVMLRSRVLARRGQGRLRGRHHFHPGVFGFGRYSRLSEVFLGDDVGRDLAPRGRHDDAVHVEYELAVGISYLADALLPGDSLVGALALTRKFPFEFHVILRPASRYRPEAARCRRVCNCTIYYYLYRYT